MQRPGPGENGSN